MILERSILGGIQCLEAYSIIGGNGNVYIGQHSLKYLCTVYYRMVILTARVFHDLRF